MKAKFFVLSEDKAAAVRARILRKVEVSAAGCWIWPGVTNNQGYCAINIGGVSRLAHRAAYTAFVSVIPEGLEIDHLCRVRICVNPEHLEAVTRAENNRRSMSKSAQRARQTQCMRGHAFDAENTYRASDGRRYCRTCRAAYSRERNARHA